MRVLRPGISALLLAALILGAACGDDDDGGDRGETRAEGFPTPGGALSSDGAVIVQVSPLGSTTASDVTIDLLGPDEWPPEMGRVNYVGGVYELGPNNARFTDSVRIGLSLGPDDLGSVSLAEAAPLAWLLLRGADGRWEVLPRLTPPTIEGERLYVWGLTGHFSILVAVLSEVPEAEAAALNRGARN